MPKTWNWWLTIQTISVARMGGVKPDRITDMHWQKTTGGARPGALAGRIDLTDSTHILANSLNGSVLGELLVAFGLAGFRLALQELGVEAPKLQPRGEKTYWCAWAPREVVGQGLEAGPFVQVDQDNPEDPAEIASFAVYLTDTQLALLEMRGAAVFFDTLITPAAQCGFDLCVSIVRPSD